jgi:hypothetical protein
VENLYLKLLILTLLPFATLYLQGVGQKHSAAALLVALATGRVVKSFFTKGLHRSKCHFNHFADFSIQGFPVLEATDTYEIPLGVFAGFSGQYTFDVQEIENFAPDTDITFEDRLAGQIINLRTTTQYTAHIADEGDIRDRFFLHINGPTSVPVIDSKLTKVYAVNNQIYIRHTGSSEILDVEVINTLGQTVISTPVNATETTITVPGRNLVYIVKVRTSEGIESHKLLIR